MKTLTLTLSAALLALGVFAGNGEKSAENYTVNTEKSTVYWTGKKVTGQHTGTLKLTGGSVTIENGKPVAATMNLDMSSIIVTDIEDEKTNAKLKGHLHSPDFFNTGEHPTGKFEATEFTPIEGASGRESNYTVKGKLTIKGKTNMVEFPAFISMKNGKLVANGEVTFDRTKYGIKYGSGSFFDDLGDKMIYDDIQLNFVLSAKK
jgi:polyisoprenoid-binding protein YceI